MKAAKKIFVKGTLGGVALALVLGLGTCSPVFAEQTGTEFKKGVINGKDAASFVSDFTKYKVWDKTSKTYNFTKDSTIKTLSITGNSAKVTINAPDVTLTLFSKDEYGVQSYCGRQYKANHNYKKVYDVDITVKELILKVDQSTKMDKEAFGIVSGSDPGKNVTVNGNVDIDVKNKYYKAPDGTGEIDPTFTNGIATIHHGNVTINGNVKVKVRVPEQEDDVEHKRIPNFLKHYYVNGIFSGLNYDTGNPGSRITISGDADVDTDGTGVHAGGQSVITIGGGGTIKTPQHDVFPFFSLNAEEGIISMNVQFDAAGEVIGAGTRPTKIYGNIGLIDREDDTPRIAGTMRTTINLGLATSDSVLHGIVFDDFKEHGKTAENDSEKSEQRANTGLRLYLQNGATWHNKSWGAMLPAGPWGGLPRAFSGSKLMSLTGGATRAQAGQIFQEDHRPISVENYSGYTTVLYEHDAADPTAIKGGDFIIKKAAGNSGVTLRTDNAGLDTSSALAEAKNKVNATLHALAQKLYYSAYASGERNLAGEVEIAEGLTTPSATLKLGNIGYHPTSGQGQYSYENAADITYGPTETVIMKGTKAALLAGALGWRSNNNDLDRRLGELRLAETERGAWVKYLGGKHDIRETHVDLDTTYHFVQLGYDTDVKGWTIGGAVEYGTVKGNAVGGHADGSVAGLAFYGTQRQEDGSYLDLIVRSGRVKNDFKVSNGAIDLSGDYKSWGFSASAEYGRRFRQQNGFYFEPSAELTFGRLQGTDCTAQGGGHTLAIHQDDFDSVIGKLTVGIGQETERSNLFLKVGVAHEFSGAFDTQFKEAGLPPKSTHVSLEDTWLNVEVGASASLSDNAYFYTTYTRSFCTDLNKEWRVDAGFRLNF